MPPYKLIAVERAQPAGRPRIGGRFRYVISNGVASVTGCRTGTHREVIEYASACVARLNGSSRPSGGRKAFNRRR